MKACATRPGWRHTGPATLAVIVLVAAQWGAPARLMAWGPHPAITRTALDALGERHPLFQVLGSHALALTNYCWMADFKRTPFPEGSGYFYADDYLLFPGMTRHMDHLCPEVRQTYRPYLNRALQALRNESPANAARWVGSLLHFVEDTGSPPHSAEIRGPVHTKMENWVDADRIRLDGYEPRLLGENDEAAADGLEWRMEGLIAFSKERGMRLRTPVLIGNQGAVRPVVLESALETARVTADLLHTLGVLAGATSASNAVLHGNIESQPPEELKGFPARIVETGTGIATLAAPDGHFELRGLQPGRHRIRAYRPGCDPVELVIQMEAGRTNAFRSVLKGSNGNRVRNGEFDLRTLGDDRPDHWYRTELGWEGEIIPVKEGRRYSLRVDFKSGAHGDVLLRWSRRVEIELPRRGPLPRIESRPITREDPELEFEGTPGMGLVQVTIRSGENTLPQEVCERIVLRAMDAGLD